MHRIIVALSLAVLFLVSSIDAQTNKATARPSVPISTQALLDGVKSPQSKGVIKSVLMIECRKDNGKGTGFVISGGNVITTNSHVVGTCSAEDLVGISAVSNEPVKFSGVVSDPDRDLALLCATKRLPFPLTLGKSEKPDVETEVETWGYPLRYESPAPVLSRGYVAGYWTETRSGKPVEHLIVNGALNPGNSGGPLIDRASGKVIGIVVEKWTLFSPLVETVITGLQHSGLMSMGGFQETDANGVTKPIPNEVAVARALKEIYDKSQVMIGEAISVSELNAFIEEKRQALTCEIR
jgi:S1-C subfamily serine protease